MTNPIQAHAFTQTIGQLALYGQSQPKINDLKYVIAILRLMLLIIEYWAKTKINN